MAVKIVHLENIINTKAIPLLAGAWWELVEAGHTDGGVPVAWDHSAFLAVDDDDAAIAVLSYINQKWSNSLFIVIGYVIPSRRRTGIYRALWEAIVARAREMKIPKVVGATHPNNKAMRATARRLGRREVGIVLSFHVEAKDLPDGTLAS